MILHQRLFSRGKKFAKHARMLTSLIVLLLHAQAFNVMYQCRPDLVSVYDDLGLRATHGPDWNDKMWLIGEASTFSSAVENMRQKVQDAFGRASEQAKELKYYTIRDMTCRKRITTGEGVWNVLYTKDNRMRYTPGNRLADEREHRVPENARAYVLEPTL